MSEKLDGRIDFSDEIKSIMRWRELTVDGVRSICPHPDGEWVRFEDIEQLFVGGIENDNL